jgi:hypothetical protein
LGAPENVSAGYDLEGAWMTTRLTTVAPDLVGLLARQTPERQRAVAVAISAWIVDRVGLADARVDAALGQLRAPHYGSTPERDALQRLVDELDESSWQVQEQVDGGSAPPSRHLEAFALARAAAALWSALDADPTSGAVEAAYEAQAAVGDVDAVRQIVERTVP